MVLVKTRISRVRVLKITRDLVLISSERLVAEANLSFALNTSLFALVPPPPAKSSTGTRQVPPALQNVEQLRGQLDGNFGTIPMCLFAFGVSLAVSKYILPQIYDRLGL